MPEFIEALSKAEAPIIYSTYAAREKFDFDGSAVRLTGMLEDAVYVTSPKRLSLCLKHRVGPKDLILVLGAGNIYDIAKSVCDPPSE